MTGKNIYKEDSGLLKIWI